MAVTAPLAGALSARVGSRVPSTVGMLVLAVGLFLLARLAPDASARTIAGALVVTGFGIGTFIPPNSSALLGSAPREQQGIASGIMATARNVGMVLGVGLAGAIFTTVLGARPAEGAPLFHAVSAGLFAAGIVAAVGVVLASGAVGSIRPGKPPLVATPAVHERCGSHDGPLVRQDAPDWNPS